MNNFWGWGSVPSTNIFKVCFWRAERMRKMAHKVDDWKWPPTQNRWTKHAIYSLISSGMVLKITQSELQLNKGSRQSIINTDWEEFVQSLCSSICVMKNSCNWMNTNILWKQPIVNRTFSSLPCQNSEWHVANLIHSLIFKRMWWQNWILSPMTSLLSVPIVNINAAVSAFNPSRAILMEMIKKHTAICTAIFQFQHFLVALCRYTPICILSVTARHGTMEPKQGIVWQGPWELTVVWT